MISLPDPDRGDIFPPGWGGYRLVSGYKVIKHGNQASTSVVVLGVLESAIIAVNVIDRLKNNSGVQESNAKFKMQNAKCKMCIDSHTRRVCSEY